jgi:hypothetical protein
MGGAPRTGGLLDDSTPPMMYLAESQTPQWLNGTCILDSTQHKGYSQNADSVEDAADQCRRFDSRAHSRRKSLLALWCRRVAHAEHPSPWDRVPQGKVDAVDTTTFR